MNSVIDIILPVYGGYDETVACIKSLLNDCCNTVRYEIIVIYDSGPDDHLLAYIERLATLKEITLLKNEDNLGFVATANLGMKLHSERDVVLLNSDTLVANNWLDRLVDCAASDEKIATITPFSNNAEICSFPAICEVNEIPMGWNVASLDATFSSVSNSMPIDIPTGVGFCMYIARRSIESVGLFDEVTFGRGYGEENDFCRRVSASGYRNVLCPNVYVFHAGGVSFGAEKLERVASAMRILNRLYPDYHAIVSNFIDRDPIKASRNRIIVEMVRANSLPTILHVTHGLGGGTEKHVNELALYFEGKFNTSILTTINKNQVQLTIYGINHICLRFDLNSDLEDFTAVIEGLGVSCIHYHHLMDVSDQLLTMLNGSGLPHYVTLHDYYFINANPTLVAKDAYFCADQDLRDEYCGEAYPIPSNMSPEQWRQRCGGIINSATVVLSPSHYTANIYKEYFPNANLCVTYHCDYFEDRPYPSVTRSRKQSKEIFKVLVLGALGREKGADLLDHTASLAANSKHPLEFHLVGYAYRQLSKHVTVHGAYQDDQLTGIIEGIKPDLIWFPCHWPETYSYTLSAALKTGLPVAAPDIGAFVERIAGRPWSWSIQWDSTAEQWLDKIADIRQEFLVCEVFSKEYPQIENDECFYLTKYGVGLSKVDTRDFDVDAILAKYLYDIDKYSQRTAREKILAVLFLIRKNPIVHYSLRLVPFEWQRWFKRKLSRRPAHEITKN